MSDEPSSSNPHRWPAVNVWVVGALATAFVLAAMYLMVAVIADTRGAHAPLALVCRATGIPREVLVALGWRPPLALFIVGTLLGRATDRGRAVTARESERTANQSPVLYLRSHRDDRLPATPTKVLPPFVLAGNRDRYEQEVARAFSIVGPVIALGLGDESEEALGAAKDYVPEAAWQARIRADLDRAALVIWSAGATPGLLWELQQIDERGHWNKTVVLVPAPTLARCTVRWLAFRLAVRCIAPALTPGTPLHHLTDATRRPFDTHTREAIDRSIRDDAATSVWLWNLELLLLQRLSHLASEAAQRNGIATHQDDCDIADTLRGLHLPLDLDAVASVVACLGAYSAPEVMAVSHVGGAAVGYALDVSSGLEPIVELDRIAADCHAHPGP